MCTCFDDFASCLASGLGEHDTRYFVALSDLICEYLIIGGDAIVVILYVSRYVP